MEDREIEVQGPRVRGRHTFQARGPSDSNVTEFENIYLFHYRHPDRN